MEKEDKNTALRAIIILGFIPALLWRGFVGSKLWLWYVVPLGLPVLSCIQFTGLWLLYVFTLKARAHRHPDMSTMVFDMTFWPGCVLLLGYGGTFLL